MKILMLQNMQQAKKDVALNATPLKYTVIVLKCIIENYKFF